MITFLYGYLFCRRFNYTGYLGGSHFFCAKPFEIKELYRKKGVSFDTTILGRGVFFMSKRKKLLADNFIGLYPVSKTLRFELKPIGKTLEHIEKSGIIDTDVHRAESYQKVKKIIDRYHKDFIEKSLSGLELSMLQDYYELYIQSRRDEKQEKEFSDIQARLRKEIVVKIKKHPDYSNLFKKELIQKDLINFTTDDEEEQELIKEFFNFTTYFSGFHQNRENMYSDEEKSTAIAYRIIHQNLPKYIDNMHIFELVKDSSIQVELDDLLQELQTKFDILSLDEYFELNGFNKVISQKGIDIYNTILGAFTEGKNKVKGLNEYINLYNQQLGKDKKERIPKMKPLFKQILSDRESVSFIPEQFDSDQAVLDAIHECYLQFQQNIFENAEMMNIGDIFKNMTQFDLRKIYVKNDNYITTISQNLYGDWSYISSKINEHYDNLDSTKNKNTIKYVEKKKKTLKNIKYYSIGDLNAILNVETDSIERIESYFEKNVFNQLQDIQDNYSICENLLCNPYADKKSLGKNDIAISKLKNLLDSIIEMQHLLKPLYIGQDISDKDEMFYSEFLRVWEILDTIIPLYNKVRNYVTRKPYSTEKVKLNFNKDTLLSGWDRNKEKDNLGIIFLKEGMYYLGIMNRNHNKVMERVPVVESKDVYKKMEYKLLPGANKMLPKVFFSKSRIEEFAPDDSIVKNYNNGTHKKGEAFNLNDCHNLIDFFKQSINKHEEWSQFGFDFSETKTYKDISGFYREVEQQGYKITFRDIDATYIDELVDKGELYLFQIYNKDFSLFSKGTPNLHTLYWKMLFDHDNLNDVVYKLNGQAEIFYRKASIKPEDIIKHKANVPVKNKDPRNQKKESLFDYDLIKDKRFTCDKFQFHVPITMNFKADGENYMNRRVNQSIHDAEDMHVIGIDRGERNLLYLTVIDMDGNIKKQMSLNEIVSCNKDNEKHIRDYHELLDAREKDNLSARQNWQTINTIKELKEGYLSQVIHVIAELMIEYNAIVVLEDLNFGFMRGRQKVEKQVYQKFEKMLIDKLNYLVDKHKAAGENGGLLKAYQLTAKFESFQRIGKQSGFLYYIPAWNTSKIDPTTGFVNLFYTKYESIEKTKEFISKFDSIIFNKQKEYFEFSFDYNKFTYKAEGSKTDWILCSYGTRIENYKNVEKNNEWDTRVVDLTEQFIALFEEKNILYMNDDLKRQILDVKDATFFQKFMKLFSLMVQMRNSDSKTGEDKIVSPVLNEYGEFFVTGSSNEVPLDADANGAFNIARKGLWIIEQIQQTDIDKLDNLKLVISNKEWLQYAQEHTL